MMFTKKKPDALQQREALLGGVPVKNALVKTTLRSNGMARLSAPLQRSWLARKLGSDADEKTFELDDLGTFCWQQIDNRRTVETLITAFAEHHKLNLREAEVSVLAFLKLLVQRNLVAIVAPKAKSD